jgi:6-phosphogluconate dehydrogenase
VASANRTERLEVNRLLGDDIGGAKKQSLTSEEGQKEKNEALKDLKDAVYCAFLASFAQGLNLIARASADEGWGVSLATCIRIWRAGCIIQCAAIADLLQPLFERAENEAEGKGKGKGGVMNILTLPPVAEEIKRTIPGLKRTVARGVEWDAHMWVLSHSSTMHTITLLIISYVQSDSKRKPRVLQVLCGPASTDTVHGGAARLFRCPLV